MGLGLPLSSAESAAAMRGGGPVFGPGEEGVWVFGGVYGGSSIVNMRWKEKAAGKVKANGKGRGEGGKEDSPVTMTLH